MRLTCRVCTGFLAIPLQVNLMRTMRCEDEWLSSGWKCFESGHLALFVVTIVMLCCSTPLGLLGALYMRIVIE